MAETMTYHTLLIALDRYPLGHRSLYGCINDIDGLKELLLAEPRVGIPNIHSIHLDILPKNQYT